MSIKSFLSSRLVIAGAFALVMLTASSFAFGVRAYPAMIADMFLKSDAGALLSANVVSVNGSPKKTVSKSSAKMFGTPNDGIIFGQGDLPLGFPSRLDRIYTLGASGEPILKSGLSDFEPSWSPDGKKIVFVTLRGSPSAVYDDARQSQRDLFTMNADGSDQRLFPSPFYGGESQPSFSPHADPDQKIIYVADFSAGGAESGIYITSTFGYDSHLLNTDGCFLDKERASERIGPARSKMLGGYFPYDTPNYSPDGNQIIFGYPGNNGTDIYKINSDGTSCSRLYTDENGSYVAANARYSRDGTKIALHSRRGYDGSHHLRIIDAMSGMVIDDLQPQNFMGSPVWAPDGSDRINYIGGDQNIDNEIRGLEIWTVDLASQLADPIYFNSIPDGVRGLDWGIPTTEDPPLSLRINSPNPLQSGSSTTGTVFLATPAPAGGAEVLLDSLGQIGAMSVPESVTIPEGETQATFPITSVDSDIDGRSADVWARYNFTYAYATVTLWRTRGDLKVNSFTAPASAAPGSTINLSWEVQNIGPVTTFGGDGVGSTGGYDYVYLSTDDQLGPEDGTPLRTGSNNPALLSGETRTVTGSPLTIPASRAPSAGQYYLIFKTNAHPYINVLESDYTNNIMVRPITIDLPDVVAESLTLPTLIEPGVSYPVEWTTRNIGTIATGIFNSCLYYSPDATLGDANDVVIETVLNNALAPNATQIHTTNVNIPTVPARADGTAYFYVKTDFNNTVYEGLPLGTGENNNTLTGNTPFEYRVADLQVTSTGAPPEVETETAFALEWTTTNAGNKAAVSFSDQVFFSTDNQVGGDAAIGSFPLPDGLAAGASVNRIQNVSIPTSAIPASGNYFVYVKTDADSQINEGVNENNNTRFHLVNVRRLLRPDLTVTNIQAPSAAFFDQTIQVQWTVTNTGQGPTNTPQWTDSLYIGTSPTSLSGAAFLQSTQSVSALNPGESYTASAIVKVPRGYNGAYHFLVKSDSYGDLNEENPNNNLRSNPVQINIPPLPDLIVETVQAPDEVFAGQEISINYTVRNIGTGDAGYRRDRIYFSRDTVLNTNQDRLIFTSDSVPSPQSGQVSSYISHNRLSNVTPIQYQLPHVPSNMEGLWYAFVITDYTDDVYEFNSENNNINYDRIEPGSPINILVSPPDLVVPSVPTAPATVASGTSFPVNFTVKNQGAFNATSLLYHAVYLSSDQTFSRDTDTLIGSFRDTNFFAPAAEHPTIVNVSLPNCLANGTYYLFGVADYDDRQFEFDPNFNAEANNASPPLAIQLSTVSPNLQITNFSVPLITTPGQSVALTWTVANSGGEITQNWIDRVYLNSLTSGVGAQQLGAFNRTGGLPAGGMYTESRSVSLPSYMEGSYYLTVTTDSNDSVPECGVAENNNSANSSNFAVENNLPDLVIDSVTAPSAAGVGDSFTVQWSGRNANQAMPDSSSSWTDSVYLSTDPTYSNGDYYIGTAMNNSILSGGQTYSKQIQATTGNIPAGNYYVLVYADTGRHIYEGTGNSLPENNNVRASGLITLTTPAIDLQVVNVSVAPPYHSGTFQNFSWTVTNFGSSQTLANNWNDYVILSRDSVLDPTDITLGYSSHSTALAGGASYTETASFFVPTGLTGDYRVFVITDRYNSVVESNNANNTSVPLTINLTLPPPAELSITNITPPTTISPGGNAAFSWTVQNTGSNAVNGRWRDTVYLSRDQFWDASDTLVGIHDLDSQTTSVPAGGGTYSMTVNFEIPPVEEGAYYVIVRTDSQNRIRETNEGNNVTTSVGTTEVRITQLQLNTPFNTTLGNGGQQFFKYVSDPDETLVFSLVTDKPYRANEAFTKFATIVSRADYDFQSQRPGEGNQENVISATQGGDYYSMVRTDLIPESFAGNFDQSPAKAADQKLETRSSLDPQNITVNARILPFSIRKVSPEVAGNAGYATIVVEGAKFQSGATMKLVRAGSPDVIPGEQRTLSNRIIGMFDLKGKAAGEYDVVVTNTNKQTATLEDGFEIVSGGGAAEPRITISGPGSAKGGRLRYTISMSNDGLNDLYLVPFFIVMPGQFNYQLDQSNFITDFSEFLSPDAIPSQVPVHYDQNGLRLIPLTAPVLGSKRTVRVNIDITVPFGFSNFEIASFAMPPLEDWYGLARTAQEEFLSRQLSNISTPAKCEGKWNLCMAEALRGIFFSLIAELLPGGCVGEGYKAVVGISDYVIGIIVKGDEANLYDAVGGTANILLGALGGIAEECFLEQIPWYKAASASVAIFKLLLDFYQCYKQYTDCMAPPPVVKDVSFPFSIDPNEKIGPSGYGAEKWVPVGQPLEYRINFENLSSASAPAQLIRITDSLPPPLDLRTVRLKEIGFKQYRFVIPANQSFYQTRVQLGADLGDLQADLLAGVDLVNDRIFWNIQAIDPNTSEAPVNPLAGILPPNNASRDGEGYVIFTAEAKSTYPSRTVISNAATIVFDQNEPIITNTTSNLLDSVVPTSQIAALPATSSVPEVPLSWSGTDDADGSGFAGHSILYSENGGSYIPYLRTALDMNTTFTGRWGKTYRFYSSGRDNADNIELAPAQPDATIRILGGDTEADVAPRPNGNDGALGGDDVAQVRRFVAGLDTDLTYNEFQRTDTAPFSDRGDGRLSIADVMQARRFVALLDPVTDASGPNEMLGVAPKTIEGKRAAMLPRELHTERVIRVGNQIQVRVRLEAQGDETGIGFTMNFDPGVLSDPVATLGSDVSGGVLTLNTGGISSGKLGVLIDKAPTDVFAAGSKTVLTVVFNLVVPSPETTTIGFGGGPIISEVVDGSANTLTTAFSTSNIVLSGPTAAGVSVSGTVTDLTGRPIANTTVSLTNASGVRRNALSGPFGYFHFDNIDSGQTYTLTGRAKLYTFAPRIISVSDDVTGILLTPNE